jgi:hypothetical protein
MVLHRTRNPGSLSIPVRFGVQALTLMNGARSAKHNLRFAWPDSGYRRFKLELILKSIFVVGIYAHIAYLHFEEARTRKFKSFLCNSELMPISHNGIAQDWNS